MTRTKTRAQANWPNNAVSVLDYGADPTGATDSTVAIQAAVDENAFVSFPAGLFKITNSINVTSATTIKGAGGHSTGTIIEGAGSSQTNSCFRFDDINNLFFDVSGFWIRKFQSGVYFLDGYPWKSSRIADLTITSCVYGIRAGSTKPLIGSVLLNMSFENLYIESCQYGIDIVGLSMVNATSFRDIRILSCISAALRIIETEPNSITPSVELTSFTFESNLNNTVELVGVCATCTDFYFEDNGYGNGDPEILLGDYTGGVSSPTRVSFKDPYFGPTGSADGKTSFKINGISTYLTVDGMQNSRAVSIDGGNFLSASNITLLNRANKITVNNFFNKEAVFPSKVIPWTPYFTNDTTDVAGSAGSTSGLFSYDGNVLTCQFWIDCPAADLAALTSGFLKIGGLPDYAVNLAGGASGQSDTAFIGGVAFGIVNGIVTDGGLLIGTVTSGANSQKIDLYKYVNSVTARVPHDGITGTNIRVSGSFTKIYYAS